MSVTPAAAPRLLPSSEVANSGTDPVVYYARLVLLNGSVETLDGSQLLALSSFDFGVQVPPPQPGGSVASQPTLSPLTLSLADPALSAALMALQQTADPAFAEIDILGYRTADGALISDASFGLSQNTSVTNAAGSVTFSASYASLELQHESPGGSGGLTGGPSGSWNSVTHAPGFSSASGTPLAAPGKLPTSGVAGPVAALQYIVSFETPIGGVVSFHSGPASGGVILSGGRVDLVPLTLTLDTNEWNAVFQAMVPASGPNTVNVQTYDSAGTLVADTAYTFNSPPQPIDLSSVASGSIAVTLMPDSFNANGTAPSGSLESAVKTTSGDPTAEQYIRLYNQSGSLVTIGGVSLFPVSSFTLGSSIAFSSGSNTLQDGAFSVSLGDSPLDVTLSALLDSATTFQEIDLLQYSIGAASTLEAEDGFGGAFGSGLTLTTGGGVATFGYQALEFQSWTNGTKDPVGFAGGGSGYTVFPNGGPHPAPSSLPADLLTLTPETFYVRFVSTSGSILTAGGAQYFTLDAAGNGTFVPTQLLSGTLAFGRPTLDPLSLALSDPATAPALLSQLTAGTPLAEIDVLGYDSAGTLVESQSFGAASVNGVEVMAGGTLQLTAAYVSEEHRQSYVAGSASGTLSSAWNSATDAAGFSNGVGGTQPYAAPAKLPLTGVAGSAPSLDYYAQVYSASGVKLTLDGASLFALDGFSAGAASNTSTVTTAGSVTLAPLNLTVTDPALAASLLGDVAQASTLGEIDVLAYDAATGTLASQATFGKVQFTAAAQNGGTVQLTAAYGATQVQQFSGSGLAQASWNAATGTPSYQGIGRGAATLTAGSLAAAAPSLDSYARFILTDGSTLTLDGQQMFALSGYAADSTVKTGVQTGGSFVPGPLTLSLTQGALTPTMLADLVKGGTLAQVDVLGYGNIATVLLSDQSFLGIGGGSLSVDASGTASLVFNYASESVQYSPTGLPPDPGPGVATGTLTVTSGQSANVSALLSALITPGLSGDTDSIVAVSGAATLNAGTVTYVAPAATGADSFTFTVRNELGQTATGTVNVAVEPTPPCFLRGTMIATPDGEVSVETLAPGDAVCLADGGSAAVVWLGHRRVDCRRHPRRQDVLPVRIAAHAFGLGRPARDLLLSPDHAVFSDGVLIPIRYLLNDATVRQEQAAVVTYWHVELAQHAVLLAEGLPAESYLDTGNRAAFANSGAVVLAHPDFARSVWAERACAPLVTEGPLRDLVYRRLVAQAFALGWRQESLGGNAIRWLQPDAPSRNARQRA